MKFVKKEHSLPHPIKKSEKSKHTNSQSSNVCTEWLIYAKHCRKRKEERKALAEEGILKSSENKTKNPTELSRDTRSAREGMRGRWKRPLARQMGTGCEARPGGEKGWAECFERRKMGLGHRLEKLLQKMTNGVTLYYHIHGEQTLN